jgi:hypothetical protein
MGALTQGEILSQTEVMAAGLRNNLAKLANRGIDNTFVGEVEVLRNQAVGLEAEQQALKSRLKEKTATLEETMSSLKAKLSEARKLIKLQIPQPGWKEFGITDVK